MKKSFYQSQRKILSALTIVCILSFSIIFSCSDSYFDSPVEPERTQAPVSLSKASPQVQSVMSIQNRHTDELMTRPGIIGTATGLTDDGKPAIVVLAQNGAAAAGLPATIENVPVRVLVTGEIRALKGRPPGNGGGEEFDATKNHRPAPNGVSLGHFNITAGNSGVSGNRWQQYFHFEQQSCNGG